MPSATTAPGGPRPRLNIGRFQLAIHSAMGQHDPPWRPADLARHLNIYPNDLTDVLRYDKPPSFAVGFALLAWLRLDPSLLALDSPAEAGPESGQEQVAA